MLIVREKKRGEDRCCSFAAGALKSPDGNKQLFLERNDVSLVESMLFQSSPGVAHGARFNDRKRVFPPPGGVLLGETPKL
ncbi:MAG: hypothetical protein HPY90_15120 [Syntrophothermus sp.]|nr:hypothetical protein [Syntrophothermus sp.]NSW84536.1 hypothetical protein [Syntrophothermus sp.]